MDNKKIAKELLKVSKFLRANENWVNEIVAHIDAIKNEASQMDDYLYEYNAEMIEAAHGNLKDMEINRTKHELQAIQRQAEEMKKKMEIVRTMWQKAG